MTKTTENPSARIPPPNKHLEFPRFHGQGLIRRLALQV
jgi:hypothetical protein